MGTADFEDQYQEWRNTTLQQGWKATDIVIGGLIDGAPYGESHTLAAARLAAVGGPQALVEAVTPVANAAVEKFQNMQLAQGRNASPEMAMKAVKTYAKAREQLGDKNTKNQCDQTIGETNEILIIL